MGQIGQLWICLPPLREQDAIADFLDTETASNDEMIAKVEAALDRVQEYRAALITAAVTGKIDVRGFTAGDGSTPVASEATVSV